jgi:glycerate kinase
MHILIAPNAFKNSCTATEAAEAIHKGLRESRLVSTFECFPIADGGDGTAELLLKKEGRWIECQVHDPLGRKIQSGFGLIANGKTAVIEMANASGVKLLKREELNPLHASSRGTGELILHALDLEVEHIILCIGGSATVDGGAGIMQALGASFKDGSGKELMGLPDALVDLHSLDLTVVDKRIYSTRITILCDVENVLLGEQGAASVFGPQKGAGPKAVVKLEASLSRLSEVVKGLTGQDMSLIKHGGAAGGTAAGLHTLVNAELVNGIFYFLEVTEFQKALNKADLVITGEGSIDTQTLQGKGPYGVAVKSREKGIPVIGFSGRLPVIPDQRLYEYFDVLLSITNSPVMYEKAIHDTLLNLERTARETGNLMSIKPA